MSDSFASNQYAESLGYSAEELRDVPVGWVSHGGGNDTHFWASADYLDLQAPGFYFP